MLVENLRFAAGTKAIGIKLLADPINVFSIWRFYLNWAQDAIDLLDEVGSDKLFFQ